MPSNISAISSPATTRKSPRKSRSSTSSRASILPKLMNMGAIGRVDVPSVTSTIAQGYISVTCSINRPKRSVTLQPLGMQTPLPRWAHDYMRSRGSGGTRYSRMSILELHRPASERLGVQCTGDDIVRAVKLPNENDGRRPLDSDFDPERLELVQLQVAERILAHYPKKQRLVKQAVYNNLALVLVRKFFGGESVATTCEYEGDLSRRRGRADLPVLDVDAARAYGSTGTTNSPPDSPSPVTPSDEQGQTTYVRKEFVASRKWSKSISYTAYSKKTIARWNRHSH